MARQAANKLKEAFHSETQASPPVAEEGKKSKPLNRKKESKSSPSLFSRLTDRARKWKLLQLSGLFLIVSAGCMIIAFTSYLFTWQQDYDKVSGAAVSILSPALKTANALGNFGAMLSNYFIGHWFGVASYGFVFLFMVWGVKLLAGISLFPQAKTFRISIFVILWASLTLGFIFHTSHLILGGGIGYYASGWLQNFAGKAGTIALIASSAIAFLIINNLVTLPELHKKPNPDENTETKMPPAETEKVVEEKPEEFKNEIKEMNPAGTIEFAVEVKKEEPQLNPGQVEFSIEKAPEIAQEAANTEETAPTNETIKPLSPYDPTLELSSYQYPPLELLHEHGKDEISITPEELTANRDRIIKTLSDYGINLKKIIATPGPTVTLYEIIPQDGTRISKIKNLEDDIALSLSALGIRIIAPMPGKGTVGIEVPNSNPAVVSMRSILDSEQFQKANMELPIALGKTISDQPFVIDLTKMPHLLMAGATGQGKSVGLNAVLVSLLYKKHPAQVKFVLIDPKKVELTLFNKIERHFLAKLPDAAEAIITDTQKVIHTLNSLCIEMNERYDLLKDAQVRNIKEYNDKFIARRLNPEKGHKYLPYIALIIDEFADLIMTAGKEVETPIARLAQLARAIGIHLIIATQRPSVNIITGTIKANFPARLAFRVISKIDSRTILDSGGADQLIGRGDMLLATGSDLIRLQCAFVTTDEVEAITDFIGSQQGYPDAFYLPEYVEEGSGDGENLDPGERDSLFEESARIVVESQQGSASLLQRKLKIGYNRAGRIVDQLQAAGIIGPFEGSKARDVLIKDFISLDEKLKAQR